MGGRRPLLKFTEPAPSPRSAPSFHRSEAPELTDFFQMLAALSTAVLAAVALYFTYKQGETRRLQAEIHRWRVGSEERDRRLQRTHDLFDRRWEIYAGVLDFLFGMSSSRGVSPAGVKVVAERLERNPSLKRVDRQDRHVQILILEQAQMDLLPLMPKAYFLFKRDATEYLSELNRHGNALIVIERKQTTGGVLPNEQRDAQNKVWRDEMQWFSEQDTIARQKFEDYLRLSDRSTCG